MDLILYFAESEQCHARFTSFSVIPAEAERQVRAAFKEHKCEEHKKPPSSVASRKEE